MCSGNHRKKTIQTRKTQAFFIRRLKNTTGTSYCNNPHQKPAEFAPTESQEFAHEAATEKKKRNENWSLERARATWHCGRYLRANGTARRYLVARTVEPNEKMRNKYRAPAACADRAENLSVD
jgi:hypothetical protein